MSEQQRLILAILLCVIYVIWVTVKIARHWRNEYAERQASHSEVIVAYASQTGNARALAEQHAQRLQQTSEVTLLPFSALTPHSLAGCRRALFVASTYGQGEPPDNGRALARHLAHLPASALANLQFEVIALGDSRYPDFCAFGKQLFALLRASGAQPLSPLTCLDHARGEDGSQLDETSQQVVTLTLADQTWLNPGSKHKLFSVILHALPDDLHWQAGDILDVQPQHSHKQVTQWLADNAISPPATLTISGAPWQTTHWLASRELPASQAEHSSNTPVPPDEVAAYLSQLPALTSRSYTIASLPGEQQLQLIVRQARHNNGKLGIASGWLTENAAPGTAITAKLHANPDCHLALLPAPLLLIGAGSGLAGIRAQYHQFVQAGHHHGMTIVYGEREPDCDNVLEAQLGPPTDNEHRYTVFSRDPVQPAYVQDKLADLAGELHQLVKNNGQIYVCGSYAGMGQAVHNTLIDLMGEATVQALIDSHRYHRDVY